MKNKKIIMLLAILLITSICIVTIIFSNKNREKYLKKLVVETYESYEENMDEGIKAFLKDKNVQKTREENKVKYIGELLRMYEQADIIREIYYDRIDLTYTFTYNYGQLMGTRGVIVLKERNPYFN